MVMGNANGRKDGEGSSEINNLERSYDQNMEHTDGGAHFGYHDFRSSQPMVQFPPHSLRAYQAPPMSHPVDSTVPSSRPGQIIHSQIQTLSRNTADNNDNESSRTTMSVKISWSHGGRQVAIIGSWDNWETRECLQNSGNEFFVTKILPLGIYHYRFIVDGWLMCAPDLPWVCDDSGNAFNILDLLVPVSELPAALSEFESPPSPPSSYDNQYLNEDDFGKPPPELPPQLQVTVLNQTSASTEDHQSQARPQLTELNHLYQSNVEGQYMALGSTYRFRKKYVTMLLFKPLRKTN